MWSIQVNIVFIFSQSFQVVCYQIDERQQLLSAINSFLDDSVVLPPGDWDSKNLLSMSEIQEMRKRRKQRQQMEMGLETTPEERKPDEMLSGDMGEKRDDDDEDDDPKGKRKKKKKHYDPLVRTNKPFGGLIKDVKRRFPWYWSDIRDGLSMQCLSTAIFIYFACLSGAIAFGGLYG